MPKKITVCVLEANSKSIKWPRGIQCIRWPERPHYGLSHSAWKQAGRWGGRRDSNPQQQAPQAWTLPLSYDHQSHAAESRKMACAGQVPPQVRPHMGCIRPFRGRQAHARHARHETPTPPGNQTPRAFRHPPARAAPAGRASVRRGGRGGGSPSCPRAPCQRCSGSRDTTCPDGR